ncbi:U3 small nucleolar ribonucleoprotein LCP5 [Candida viswanathii]|uniref:U3 small nucleolar ribonucleoprotein LCP5 n=1 Tax=Candida viswanathii TaxID=5486 RepID=A0A367XWC8_9ASCO|nr:U3 small nucleolar ribonucleoprotein LCP5 [Candida viswanathii]
MSSIDTILKDIITSTKTTKTSVDDLLTHIQESSTTHPELVTNLLKKSTTSTSQGSKLEGVSLLSLKNESLVAYINNLIMIVMSQIERLDDDDEGTEDRRLEAVKRSIVQRVTLEKGVKPLEKKINYQLDKMVRAYGRMEQDELKAEQKLNEEEEGDEESDEKEDEEDEESEDEEDDNLQYRPDASTLAKLAPSSSKSRKSTTSESNEKYKPPKISAMAPPTAISQKDIDAKSNTGKNRKVQSMEEYLQEQSDMPTVDASIGSTIVAHGRGGVKTSHDRRKEKEIQYYEENNFVRLPTSQTKKSYKEKQRDMRNQFAGEDWSMFNNKDVTKEGTSRKRKSGTVWDRVKKKKGY